MRHFLLVCLLVFLVAIVSEPMAHGQDIIIPTVSNYLTVARGVSWGTAGSCNVGAGCGVNNNYIWSPPSPDSSICVAVTNNSLVNAHPVSFNVFQTLDPTVQFYTGFQASWGAVPITSVTMPVTIAAGFTQVYFFRSTAAARLVLIVVGSTALGGTNDTANITVVQPSVNSWCGPGANNSANSVVTGPSLNGTTVSNGSTVSPVLIGGLVPPASYNVRTLEMVADPSNINIAAPIFPGGSSSFQSQITGTGSAFTSPSCININGTLCIFPSVPISPPISAATGLYPQVGTGTEFERFAITGLQHSYAVRGALTNPTGPQTVLSFFGPNTGTGNIAAGLYSLRVNCSATCEVLVARISARGTTCSAITLASASASYFNSTLPAFPAPSTFVAENNCSGSQPTNQFTIYDEFLAANSSTEFDLKGYEIQNTSAQGNQGLMVQIVGTITGVVAATLKYSLEF